MITFNNFTWRKKWINSTESPFSILEKFKMANNINKKELHQTFALQGEGLMKFNSKLSKWNLLTLEAYDDTKFKSIMGFSLVSLNIANINRLLTPLDIKGMHYTDFFYGELRYCEECLSKGYHSLIHQFLFTNLCPFHQYKLCRQCPKCNLSIKYETQDNKPFRCICGHNFLIEENKEFFHYWGRDVEIVDSQFTRYLQSNSIKLIYFDSTNITKKDLSIDLRLLNLLHTHNSNFSIIKKSQQNININTIDSYQKIYYISKVIFKSIARHLRKRLCKNHRKCINQYVKNSPKINFCPYALAYVEWRKEVEGLSSHSKVDNKYRKDIKNTIGELNCYFISDNESMIRLYNYCKSVWNEIGNNHLVVEKLIAIHLGKLLISRFNKYLYYFKDSKKNEHYRNIDFVNPVIIHQIISIKGYSKIFTNEMSYE
ncbi:hypothetical protein ACLIA0_11970 [Bacillaceae bacterium W0354]